MELIRRLSGQLDDLLVRSEPALQRADEFRGRVAPEAAFPHHGNPPPRGAQCSDIPAVPLDVGDELRLPEFGSSGRVGRVSALRVTMPETTMDEHDRSPARQDQIRPARQRSVMKPVSIAPAMKRAPEDEFGPRVPTTYPGHHARPRRPIHYIDHRELAGRKVRTWYWHSLQRARFN